MADQLFLNLWFPSFEEPEIIPRLLSVLQQIPFSEIRPGVAYAAVHPISRSEPVIFEQTFDYGTDPEDASIIITEFLHADHAYEIEAFWDLYVPKKEGDLDEKWVSEMQRVRFFAHGTDFDEGTFQEDGHVQIEFGLDTPFLNDEVEFTPEVVAKVKSNVQKLVMFVLDIEKNCGITGRVLWSEGDGNLAQKLIAKLQKVQ